MNLIFLYGPPGVGKLTVGKELEKLTGYELYHNHVAVDAAYNKFPENWEYIFALCRTMRLKKFEDALKKKQNGLIFTFVYGKLHKSDDEFIAEIHTLFEQYKGTIHYVRLSCSVPTLKQRVTNQSRKKFRKTQSVKRLNELMEKYDIVSEIPHSNSITVNTDELSAIEAAHEIQEHFKL